MAEPESEASNAADALPGLASSDIFGLGVLATVNAMVVTNSKAQPSSDVDSDAEAVVIADKDGSEAGAEVEVDKKKRAVKKRAVGSASKSIKQMKDAVVRTQSVIASSKVATIHAMSCYASEKADKNNPRCHTVLMNFNEIVERPDKNVEGERTRDKPKWTLLLPKDLDHKDFGMEVEMLGKAMQVYQHQPAVQKKKQKGKGNKRGQSESGGGDEFDFDLALVSDSQEYLASIYGKPVTKKNKKVMLEEDESS
jgi:hypothetical protein